MFRLMPGIAVEIVFEFEKNVDDVPFGLTKTSFACWPTLDVAPVAGVSPTALRKLLVSPLGPPATPSTMPCGPVVLLVILTSFPTGSKVATTPAADWLIFVRTLAIL